jgi:plasmid stabilization system protein ParE
MPKYKVSYLDRAKNELREIYHNIFELSASEKSAYKAVKQIDDAVFILEEHPRFYRESFKRKGYRIGIADKYIFIYRVVDEDKEVLITRIFHGAKNHDY